MTTIRKCAQINFNCLDVIAFVGGFSSSYPGCIWKYNGKGFATRVSFLRKFFNRRVNSNYFSSQRAPKFQVFLEISSGIIKDNNVGGRGIKILV